MNITKGKTDEFETRSWLLIFRFGWRSPQNPCLPSCFYLSANPRTGDFSMIQVETISNQVRTGTLDISWSDGRRQQFTLTFLRNQCQCTECKSLRLRGRTIDVPLPRLRIAEIRPVGAYGVQLVFSDGHDRGVYPWTYLRELTQPEDQER
jgi:DUF971 family protein